MENKIEIIRKNYNEGAFRMALQHLMECGTKLLSDEKNIDETCKEIMQDTSENAIVTPAFKCHILRCAAELARVDVWDLFRYIKVNLDFDNIKIIEGKIVSFQGNCTGNEYWKCVVPSEVDEEIIEDVNNKISELMDAHAKENAEDFSDFDMVNSIISAFNHFGIKAKSITPDMCVYI